MPSSKPLFYEAAIPYIGDPTSGGTGMIAAGEVEDAITHNLNYETYNATIDRVGKTPIKGTEVSDIRPQVSLPLIGNGLEQTIKLIGNAVDYGGSGSVMGFSEGPKNLDDSDYFALALVPISDAKAGNGLSSPNALWYLNAVCENYGDIVRDAYRSDDALTNYSHDVTIGARYAAKDLGGTDIPEGLRYGFRGPIDQIMTGGGTPTQVFGNYSLPTYDPSI